MSSIILRSRRSTFPRCVLAGLVTDICVDDSPQLTEKFGLVKVKEMLKDIGLL
jgi:hypothetical protein